jgi:hypothetical protein
VGFCLGFWPAFCVGSWLGFCAGMVVGGAPGLNCYFCRLMALGKLPRSDDVSVPATS